MSNDIKDKLHTVFQIDKLEDALFYKKSIYFKNLLIFVFREKIMNLRNIIMNIYCQ